jgi:hypothetical protein
MAALYVSADASLFYPDVSGTFPPEKITNSITSRVAHGGQLSEPF